MKQKGFTLIELLVTLAILAIVASFAVPSFLEQIRKAELKDYVTDTAALLTQTRSQALATASNKEADIATIKAPTNASYAKSPTSAPTKIAYNREGLAGTLKSGVFTPLTQAEMVLTFSHSQINSTYKMRILRTGSVKLLQ